MYDNLCLHTGFSASEVAARAAKAAALAARWGFGPHGGTGQQPPQPNQPNAAPTEPLAPNLHPLACAKPHPPVHWHAAQAPLWRPYNPHYRPPTLWQRVRGVWPQLPTLWRALRAGLAQPTTPEQGQ